MARSMINRTILLLLGVSVSLVSGWPNSTLQAQQPAAAQQEQIDNMLRQIEPAKFQFDPARFPSNPGIPPPITQYRPPAWVKFLDSNPYLAAPIFAGVVTLAIAIFIWMPSRIVLGLIHVLASRRGRDNGDTSTSKRAQRVSVVVLLLAIGLAVAFIVHAVVNASR